MKKLTTLVLVFSLMLFTGCSNRSSSEDVKTSSNTEISSQADSQAETTAVTTTTVADTTTTEETTTTTAETTTTTAEQDKPDYPELKERRFVLPSYHISQLPELPRGSEVTSAAILLNSFGLTVDKMDILPYLPITKTPDENGVWPSAFDSYLGDPTTDGYGCYRPVIKKTITDLFEKNNATIYKVADYSKTSLVDLFTEIEKGYFMMIWVTENMEEPKMISLSITEGTFEWPENEHCVVLIGYDLDKDTVIVCDPLSDNESVEYPREIVENVYNRLGKQALTIHSTL